MQLQWNLHPKQTNVQTARSAAYQYRLQEWNDGRAELAVQHRGDRPSARPIKRFAYKTHKAAENGAQRFEDKHGYADPAHAAPAEIAPFLTALPKPVTEIVESAARTIRALALSVRVMGNEDAQRRLEVQTAKYTELCAALLCCTQYGCYARTEINQSLCGTHRELNERNEDGESS